MIVAAAIFQQSLELYIEKLEQAGKAHALSRGGFVVASVGVHGDLVHSVLGSLVHSSSSLSGRDFTLSTVWVSGKSCKLSW